MSSRNVHWLGAGLSSGPGILALARSGRNLVLWNRTVQRAHDVFSNSNVPPTTSIRKFELQDFQNAVHAGDIVVSMLPAGMHPAIAEICLTHKAHLVTTSYISETMRALHSKAAALGLSFVNECGLDPGIDHVLAHLLVKEYRESPSYDANSTLHFKSYCGGFPREPNDFRYKFSWSPVGVLRALTNQARFIENSRETTATRAWEVVKPMEIAGEGFEVYPNRDSLPYLKEYGFEPSWKVDTFVRGTIRLGGWANAWSEIFAQIPGASNEKLEALGAELWSKYAYATGEEDRVVLYVSLESLKGDKVNWSKHYLLDESGSGRNTAMGRLVSLPATFAVGAIEKGKVAQGVTGAPDDKDIIAYWLKGLNINEPFSGGA